MRARVRCLLRWWAIGLEPVRDDRFSIRPPHHGGIRSVGASIQPSVLDIAGGVGVDDRGAERHPAIGKLDGNALILPVAFPARGWAKATPVESRVRVATTAMPAIRAVLLVSSLT